jgi:hypothetical protein
MPNLRKGEETMLLYSFNADLREVLRRLATAAQNGDGQNGASMRREVCTHLTVAHLLSRNNNGGHHEPITMSSDKTRTDVRDSVTEKEENNNEKVK